MLDKTIQDKISKCKKCFGRGYIGADRLGNAIWCECVLDLRKDVMIQASDLDVKIGKDGTIESLRWRGKS